MGERVSFLPFLLPELLLNPDGLSCWMERVDIQQDRFREILMNLLLARKIFSDYKAEISRLVPGAEIDCIFALKVLGAGRSFFEGFSKGDLSHCGKEFHARFETLARLGVRHIDTVLEDVEAALRSGKKTASARLGTHLIAICLHALNIIEIALDEAAKSAWVRS